MNKKIHVIENTCPAEQRRKVLLPILGVIMFGGVLFWSVNHIAGGCTSLGDVLTYCEISTK